MSIQGARAAVVLGARRDARASRGSVSVAAAGGEGAQAGRADGALPGTDLVQRGAVSGSGAAADGAAGIVGPLAYRRGALTGVPRGLERGKRLDVRV